MSVEMPTALPRRGALQAAAQWGPIVANRWDQSTAPPREMSRARETDRRGWTGRGERRRNRVPGSRT